MKIFLIHFQVLWSYDCDAKKETLIMRSLNLAIVIAALIFVFTVFGADAEWTGVTVTPQQPVDDYEVPNQEASSLKDIGPNGDYVTGNENVGNYIDTSVTEANGKHAGAYTDKTAREVIAHVQSNKEIALAEQEARNEARRATEGIADTKEIIEFTLEEAKRCLDNAESAKAEDDTEGFEMWMSKYTEIMAQLKNNQSDTPTGPSAANGFLGLGLVTRIVILGVVVLVAGSAVAVVMYKRRKKSVHRQRGKRAGAKNKKKTPAKEENKETENKKTDSSENDKDDQPIS